MRSLPGTWGEPLKAKTIILSLLGLVFLISACAPLTQPENQENGLVVSVSIPPQAYFLERIAGDRVTVNVMVGPGDDPHSYEPTPDQMRALAQSQLYFSIGVEFEHAWLDRFRSVNPQMQIVDTTIGIERILMTEDQDHSDAEYDPHVWLSPKLVESQVNIMAEALIGNDPANETVYRNGLQELLADIRNVDTYISASLASLASRKVMTFHPAWNYFARDFHLEVIAVEVGGQEPGAAELKRIVDLAKANQISVIFAQSTFSSRSAQALADEINAQVVLLDPLAYDWLSNMVMVADAFAR